MGEEMKLVELSKARPPGSIEEARVEPQSFRRKHTCLTCCGACCIILILIVVVIIILAFTLFKAKNPKIHVDNITLENFKFKLLLNIPPTLSLNVTLGLNISLENPNKVSLKYTNSTSHMFYRGLEVGLVPIPPGHVTASGKEYIFSTLNFMAEHLITNSHFISDYQNGSLPFSTITRVLGRVNIFNIYKHHFDASSICNITIFTSNQSIS
eukprot:c17417_g2_i1 orf=2-631(-)